MYRGLAAVLALWSALICNAAATTLTHVPLPPDKPLKSSEEDKRRSTKPASALFSEKQLPSIGRAMAIGY
jgi:hypothetical protein